MKKSKKANLESLIGKEIRLTDQKGWMKSGTIYTDNKKHYAFLFKQFENCYGCMPLQKGEINHLFSNVYSLHN